MFVAGKRVSEPFSSVFYELCPLDRLDPLDACEPLDALEPLDFSSRGRRTVNSLPIPSPPL